VLLSTLILCLVWKHCRKSLLLSLRNTNVAFLWISWSTSKLDPITWVFSFWARCSYTGPYEVRLVGDLIPLIFPWGRSYFMIPNILSVQNIPPTFKWCFSCENFRQTDIVANLALESPPICNHPNYCCVPTFSTSIVAACSEMLRSPVAPLLWHPCLSVSLSVMRVAAEL
jgi:hypothetical protein